MVASQALTAVAVGVEGRVNVNQIHAVVGQPGELFQIVAAINDAGVEKGGGFQFGGGLPRAARQFRSQRDRLHLTSRSLRTAIVGNEARGDARPTGRFRAGRFLCHAASVRRKVGRGKESVRRNQSGNHGLCNRKNKLPAGGVMFR